MSTMSHPAYETILVEQKGRVGVITLNRPQALNALNNQVMREVTTAMKVFDSTDDIGCLVVTGSKKAFAAGADIKEMEPNSFHDVHRLNWFGLWDDVVNIRVPIIAAVSGYALGGGCELAMLCDFILCSDTAKFGQPEIKLGVMPAMGGSQRLTPAVGKSKAMEMVLTGRMMDAAEAERAGLVSRIIPVDELMDEALKTAGVIAAMSLPSARYNKDAVNRAFEVSLNEGVRFERRAFWSLFATNDQKEGMGAFIAKRPPNFSNS